MLLCLLVLALPALAAPRVGVVTMQPGEIFWERFGHNAIVVADPDTGSATSYNFGFFDLGEPDFIERFILGDMRYRLVALPFEQDLISYREDGRGVSIQWLDLDDADARRLADALEWNARPENARYRYDYFLDNCSTRVRDAIDFALHGRLRPQLEGRSRGNTYRSEALRLVSPVPPLWLGFDIGLGPAADVPLSLWGEAFVPMRLADALRDARRADGRPLVRDEQQLLPHRLSPEPQGSVVRWPLWALAGIVIGAGLSWLGRQRPRALAAVALPFWTVTGLAGALMLFIWLGTAHQFGWSSHNLLLFNPLGWLLLPGAWRLLRGRPPGRWFAAMLLVVLSCVALALFAHWLPLMPQRNVHWIALLLPVHAGLWLGLRPRAGMSLHSADAR
ncbi:MAG: DUF4105 domain-containing protein [Pseudomonadota bacterium]|nr:DUF4105 domain-containing protein [Pseudomonadota bacterium]